MEPPVSAFETLGLPETATPEEVKARWRELASEHHPDKGGDAEKFDEYRQAYERAYREASEPKPCQPCGGSGKRVVQRGFAQIKLPCEACNGSGVTR